MRNRTYKAPDDLHEALRAAAAFNGEDVSSVLRRAAQGYVARTQQKKDAERQRSVSIAIASQAG